jgi:hypothetical protein
MHALTARELLHAWGHAGSHKPVKRSLLLLAAACPEESWETLARLSIGQRDARLLTLHESTFGPCLSCLTECPACHERLELDLEVNDIRLASESGGADHLISVDGDEVRFRVPNSIDLAALENEHALEAARQILLERCVLEAEHQGEPATPAELSPATVEAMVECMGDVDAQADVRFTLSCPVCGHEWESMFDIAPFLWSEIDAWARRTLDEIHVLASAYGWSEADILAMTPWRRHRYIEMVGA